MPRLDPETGLKECSRCHEEKPASEYQKQNTSVDGCTTRCKMCLSEVRRSRYIAKPRKPYPDGGTRLDVSTGLKRCCRCHAYKEADEFHRCRSAFDGLSYMCAACARASVNAKNRELGMVPRDVWRTGTMLDTSTMLKTCSACAEVKSKSDFYAAPDKPDGLRTYCIACTRESTRRSRLANRKTDALCSSRRRARLAGVTHDGSSVTPSDYKAKWEMWGGMCWICGDTAEHMDHVKPISKGGANILANLRPACRTCNSMKSARWPFPTDSYSAFIEVYRGVA